MHGRPGQTQEDSDELNLLRACTIVQISCCASSAASALGVWNLPVRKPNDTVDVASHLKP